MIRFRPRELLLHRSPLERETGPHAVPQPGATDVLGSLLWATAGATSQKVDPGH